MNNINIAGRVVKIETRGSGSQPSPSPDRVKLKDGKTYIDEATGYTAKETEFQRSPASTGSSRSGASRKKGDVVAISGSLHYSSWEDRDGITRYGCEIWADKIDFFPLTLKGGACARLPLRVQRRRQRHHRRSRRPRRGQAGSIAGRGDTARRQRPSLFSIASSLPFGAFITTAPARSGLRRSVASAPAPPSADQRHRLLPRGPRPRNSGASLVGAVQLSG